jgi:DNA-binding GntR family transcriptional regulator
MPGLDDAALMRMADLAGAMERADGDVDAFLRADREFHLTSYAAAPPGETSKIIGRLWNTSQHYRREFTKLAAHRDGLGVTHLEHRLLLDCLRRGDADDAERVLVMHVRRTRLELSRHPEIFG